MKAIHNSTSYHCPYVIVVLYPKDTEKWKQFTTMVYVIDVITKLFCIPKILKNESNSQPEEARSALIPRCFVSQRYWKMKAIHNLDIKWMFNFKVVLYPKDTEKWKQFTTWPGTILTYFMLFCIPKILKNESNSQQWTASELSKRCCFVSQRYWKMKAIHNYSISRRVVEAVVLYPKDTEKWKQFTTDYTLWFI